MELAEDMFIYYVVTDQGVARAVSLNVRPKDPTIAQTTHLTQATPMLYCYTAMHYSGYHCSITAHNAY